MAKETKPTPQELSQPEADLQALHNNIVAAHRNLMGTFFRDDTWNVRQAATYGLPLLEVEGDGQNHDWDREEQIVGGILGELGDRIGYYEPAYHFPDSLTALGHMSSADWVEMLAEQDGTKSKTEIAAEELARTRARIQDETGKFGQFLGSDELRQAFTVQVDKKTGAYRIEDLPLNPNELQARWQGWFGGDTVES